MKLLIIVLLSYFLLIYSNNCHAQKVKETETATKKIGPDLEGKTYKEVDALVVKYYKVSAYEQAITCTEFAREKSRLEFGKEDSIYIRYTANLGFFYYNSGQYEMAEVMYLEAQALMLNFYGKTNETYSSLLNNLATVYRSIGQYEMAESLYGEVKTIDKELFGPNSRQYAIGLNNLALLYISQERYTDAEPLLLRTKEIRGKHYGLDHFIYARALNNLAGLYTMMKRYDEAVTLSKEAKKIKLKKFGKDHLSYSKSIHNLAALYRLQEKYEQAEPLYLEALKIEAKFLGKTHPEYVNSLIQLVLLYYFAEKDSLAWSFLKETESAITQVDLPPNITEAWKDSLFLIGNNPHSNLEHILKFLDLTYLLLERQGTKLSRQQQVLVVDLTLALLEKRRHGFFNYKDKLRLLSQSNEWTLRSLSLLDKQEEVSKIFEVAEQNKSVLLMEASQAQTAYQMGGLPDSLIQIEQEIIKEQEQIYNQLQDKRTLTEKDSLRELLNKFNKKIKLFKSQIEQKFPKYTNLKYQQNDTQASEIQALLKEDEAMLEYVMGDSSIYILYLDQDNFQVIEQPLTKEKLSKEIKNLHRTLSNYKLLSKQEKKAYRSYTSSAHWFYQNLVAPALNSSSKIKKLIVITDGELGHLPFEVFLVEAAPQLVTEYANLHYLINDYVFSYHYSATLWKENKERLAPQNNGQILGVTANYTTQIDSSKQITRLPAYQRIRANLSVLPSARKEVEMLSKQFKGYFAFDNKASEKIFKEKASQFAVVHLAMHGLLNSRAQMLSSLVFTEDSDSVENNFLQAYEVSRLNLNADLVVLSACETGYGKFEKGNGIASLARAFMYAGASSLVVSLWQVNDFSTGEIMKLFYQNLLKGMGKGAALREAKLEYMKRAEGIFKHPAFWSPFVQIGTTDAIRLKTKSKYSFLWWGLGILSTILLFVFWRKKR